MEIEKVSGGEEAEVEKTAEQNEIDEALKSFEESEAEEVAKAEAEVEREEPKKRRWLLNVFLIAIIAVGVYLMFRITSEFSETNKSLWEILNEADTLFAILTFASLLTILVAESMKYAIIMRAVTGKFHPIISLKTMFVGKYYDNITPFSTGGQPMQIYFLCKKGFAGGVSGAVIMIKYFANTFIWLIVAGVLMATNASALGSLGGSLTLRVLAWVGWGINMVIPTSVIFFVILPKFSYALTKALIFIGAKLKIVKDKEKTLAKSVKIVSDFKASFKIMSKKPATLIALILCCTLEICLTFAFPFFIAETFGELAIPETGLNAVIRVMAINAFIAFAVSPIPTPGNSGAWEGASSVAFRAIASSAWVLFTWRFFVYYIYIVIGLGITVFEVVSNLTRGRRNNKK
ncbi:MAG: flippase-like domain-containing protein [Clostridia bacterium]|nr:flippase-like domain-containing protein [Clostridia bacterium]